LLLNAHSAIVCYNFLPEDDSKLELKYNQTKKYVKNNNYWIVTPSKDSNLAKPGYFFCFSGMKFKKRAKKKSHTDK
jgi:hypothetical protein